MKKSKGRYPFRIGCTSYVIPDEIIPNVEYMGRYVDDIELVLFESPDVSNLPSEADVERLLELADEYDLTYSVHFPTTHKAGGTDAALFRSDLRKVVELASPLDPFAWVLHLEGLAVASAGEISEWQLLSRDAFAELADCIDDMSRVVVENLAYPWRLHESTAKEFGASLCLDVGHLWVNQSDEWKEEAEDMLASARVVHLHGLCDGRDHLSLRKSSKTALSDFLQLLRKAAYAGLVTLEVFSEQDTEESLEVLAELWG